MSKTNPARGMRDFLPADVRRREYVIGIIKEVYEAYGFEPLETPAVENIETLMGKYGEEGNQLIFKILKRGEKLDEALTDNPQSAVVRNPQLADLALRYDLTVPLARVVANRKNDIPKFFKRYQIQPVWRADRPARGRFREFFQCDVDWIGSSSMVVEAEIISACETILDRLGFSDFVIRINHRELLRGMLEVAGIESGKQDEALVALDKLDKIGPAGVSKEFEDRGIAGASLLLDLFGRLNGSGNAAALAELSEFMSNNKSGIESMKDLQELLSLSQSSRLNLDPSLARGLSYYTGTIMEINVPDLAGSLGGGGRYDGLIGMFGKERIPACGFSLGLERILFVMEERGMFPPAIAESSPADVMVTIWDEFSVAESLKLANQLRAAGIRATVYPEPDKFGKQMKYADSIKVPYVAILGESEAAAGKVKLKNMSSGEEALLSPDEIKGFVSR